MSSSGSWWYVRKLSAGIAPVARMRELGLDVGIGTDGPASNNDLDMFEEVRLAALLAGQVDMIAAWQAGDTDMALEMTSFTKNQILVQAGTAMLAQANQAPQSVLQLLQG